MSLQESIKQLEKLSGKKIILKEDSIIIQSTNNFEKTPEIVKKVVNSFMGYYLRAVSRGDNRKITLEAKRLSKIIPLDFLQYMKSTYNNNTVKYGVDLIIAQYYKQHPEQEEGHEEKINIIEILRRETTQLYEDFLKATEKYAKEYFEHITKELAKPMESWYEQYRIKYIKDEKGNLKPDFVGLNRDDYYRMRDVYNKYLAIKNQGYEKLLEKELKYAKEHYESSLNKLTARIKQKDLDYKNLQVRTARIGRNIETTFTDGKQIVRAWTVIAKGPIQRPHYRYLVK